MPFLLIFFLSVAIAASEENVSTPTPEESTRRSIEAVLADFDAKRTDEALAKLVVLEKKLPDDPLVLNLIGSAYLQKKDYLAAEAYFRKSLKKSPGFFPSLYNLGEILFLQKKYTEAREHFQAMRASDARNELLQFKVVLCSLALNEPEKAKSVMDAIKYPGDSPAWYYAQAAYQNHAGNQQKAREFVAGAKYIFGPKTALFDETFESAGITLK